MSDQRNPLSYAGWTSTDPDNPLSLVENMNQLALGPMYAPRAQGDTATVSAGAGVPISSGNIKGQLPIVRYRQDASAIKSTLPEVADGFTRLWRGNRPGEIGKNPQFTNDLPGIALPFREAYGGHISYVDVPTDDLGKYVSTSGAAPNAEFTLPASLAKQAQTVLVKPNGTNGN